MSLSGSYLATIPHECSLRTDTITIININDEIRGQPLKITEIPNEFNLVEEDKIPHITLNSINLKSLQHLEDRILLQSPVKLNHIDVSLYHTTIPLYTVVLGTAALALTIIIRRYTQSKSKSTTPGEELGEETVHTYAVPEGSNTQGKVPATFSLKILK